jgi:hypothetical protein
MTLATQTSCHDEKPVEMADPSKGNNLAMMMACTAAATRISITLPAAAMTKGKAPAAMTMIHSTKSRGKPLQLQRSITGCREQKT